MMPPWRDSGRTVKVGPVDARVLVPWVIWIPVSSPWIIWLAVLITAGVGWLNHKEISIEGALRRVRSWLAGPERPAMASRYHRRLT